MIAIGDSLPQVTFSLRQQGEVSNPNTEALFSGKKVVLFAVPGAFTPTCSEAHLPGYIESAAALADKGVDEVICLSVNDAFVMEAWGNTYGEHSVTMLADGGAEFTRAIGLEVDTQGFGGVRSRRYAMVVDNGVVSQLFVEPPKTFDVSSAQKVLADL